MSAYVAGFKMLVIDQHELTSRSASPCLSQHLAQVPTNSTYPYHGYSKPRERRLTRNVALGHESVVDTTQIETENTYIVDWQSLITRRFTRCLQQIQGCERVGDRGGVNYNNRKCSAFPIGLRNPCFDFSPASIIKITLPCE